MRKTSILIAKFRDPTRWTSAVKNRSRSAGRCRARCIYGVLRCTLWLVNFGHVRWRTHKLELELIIETFIRRNYTWENKGAENSFPVTTTQHHQTCKTKSKTDFLVSDRSWPKTDGLRPHHCRQLVPCGITAALVVSRYQNVPWTKPYW